ncbi:krev interaction trapped protein 1 [Biomphalaria glabrata]|nr:krev interaction trapped protein 1-like [Biomphalaria glabrata]
MDIVVAVIRPKPGHASSTYKPQLYEILLLDSKSPPGDRVKMSKYLPMMTLMSLDEEPREVVLTKVHKLIGIKGDRALLIQWNREMLASHRLSLSQFSLYFVPVGSSEKIHKKYVEQVQNPPSFYPLEYVLDALDTNAVHFPSPTRLFLFHLDSWLKEKHLRPTAIERAFQQKAEFRIHLTIHNPAFIPSRITSEVDGGGSGNMAHFSQEIVKNANEALAKMLSIEKCDSVVINPLFGSLLPYKTKPNSYVINPHWPNVPSYHKVPENGFSKYTWQNKYPLHHFAAQGEKTEVEILLKQGYNHSVLDNVGYAPIHYAAKYDYISVVEALLIGGCSPNLVDSTKTTALHMAAKRGSIQLAKCLLQRPDIDLDIRDKDGCRAIDICVSASNKTPGQEQVEVLIKEASKRPSYTVEVFLMDKSSKNLKLVSGFRTTVQQLNELLMKEFNLPQNYWDIFTLWIGSKSLELQLKLDHEVVRELQQWNTRSVSMLTDRRNPSEEEPLLTWRRNVKVSVEKEKLLQHPKALDLLYYEARHNYINGLYPCKGKDTINFATMILAHEHQGTTNIKSVLANLSQSQLKDLVPAAVLRTKDTNYWLNKISKTYANFKDIPQQQLKSQFLAGCQRLSVYGSAFFTGKIANPLTQCYIGVNDIGIHMISVQTKKMIHSLDYKDISWRHIQEKTLLEIKILRSAHNVIEIRTRQAGLIDHLMQQLDRMHSR